MLVSVTNYFFRCWSQSIFKDYHFKSQNNADNAVEVVVDEASFDNGHKSTLNNVQMSRNNQNSCYTSQKHRLGTVVRM